MSAHPAVSVGEKCRDSGISRVAAASGAFLAAVRDQARILSHRNGQVTVEELRQWAQERGLEPRHPNAWGAVFRGEGWEAIGYRQNRVPSAHNRMVRIWRWTGDSPED